MNRLICISLMAILLCLSACMSHRGFVENSTTRFSSADEPMRSHIRNYRRIIYVAEKNNRVTPGLYLEFGYMLAKTGQLKLAHEYFNKEKELWPESAPLVDQLLKYEFK